MLSRKMWREIKANFGAYLAVTSVLAIGLMLFVSLSIILDNLTDSQEEYYQNTHFAEVFAKVVKMPLSAITEIKRLSGVKAAQGRIVKNVLVNKKNNVDITTLRLVSFTDGQQINKFMLQKGRIPSPAQREILVSEAFLSGNSLKLGDKIPLIIQGREVEFTITGTVISPEYVYEIPNAQAIAPNPKSFGFAFVPYEAIATLLGMQGQVNDINLILDKGVSFQKGKLPLERTLNDYGLTELYERKDQLSHSLLTQELVGLKASATTTPLIFLLVAAGILYIMLRRMVESQRGQIGILKAFGFSDSEIMLHYAGYAILIGFFGGLLGCTAGGAFSFSLAKIYQQYYNLPDLHGSFDISYIIIGTILSVIFCALAGIQGAKQVLHLAPVDAMRASAPVIGTKSLIENIKFFWNALNIQGKMAIRNLFRNKKRTAMVIVGISSAFSLMVAGGASFDSTDFMINFQFGQVEKYDLKVALTNFNNTSGVVSSAKELTGVEKAEPILEVPVTINNKGLKKDALITGLTPNSTLYNLVNNKGQKESLAQNNIVLSQQLAKILNLKTGDNINIKILLGDKPTKQVRIAKIIPQYVGLGAYMQLEDLSKLLNAPPVASSVLLKVNQQLLPELKTELQKGQNVAGIIDKTRIKAQFEELMASTQSTKFVMLFFAFLTGFAIVYNVTIISLSERERELATLLVLGMTEREVAKILVYEQWFLGVMGVICGIPLSYLMLYGIATGSANEVYNMPIIISATSFIIGILGTALFLLVSQWKASGKIDNLSMLDVLKEQE